MHLQFEMKQDDRFSRENGQIIRMDRMEYLR